MLRQRVASILRSPCVQARLGIGATRRPLGTSALVSSESTAYPGAAVPFTNVLKFTDSKPEVPYPCFRVMDERGEDIPSDSPIEMPKELALDVYTAMVKTQIMDTIFYEAQRQGRFSFYMTSAGEEAVCVGSAAALQSDDVVLAQYREQGVLMYRGFTLDDFANQCFANCHDAGKGRQMPVHYGASELYFHTVSSPLGTQIPQAAGVAYALAAGGEARAAVCYFGDGAASEGDFHAGLNFAATLDAPVVFFCRNNGWAISTPVEEQYRGDGIAGRGTAYGIPTLRVDGNDAVAVWHATKVARDMAVEGGHPVLLEGMSYRSSHHSTSDDSSRYRGEGEMAFWRGREPVGRFRLWLERRQWWDEAQDKALRDSVRSEVVAALERAEAAPKVHTDQLCNDVYAVKPPVLREQEAAVRLMMQRFPEDFKLGSH